MAILKKGDYYRLTGKALIYAEIEESDKVYYPALFFFDEASDFINICEHFDISKQEIFGCMEDYGGDINQFVYSHDFETIDELLKEDIDIDVLFAGAFLGKRSADDVYDAARTEVMDLLNEYFEEFYLQKDFREKITKQYTDYGSDELYFFLKKQVDWLLDAIEREDEVSIKRSEMYLIAFFENCPFSSEIDMLIEYAWMDHPDKKEIIEKQIKKIKSICEDTGEGYTTAARHKKDIEELLQE